MRIVKEAIRLHGSFHLVPITRELLTSVRSSHSEYQLYLENERKQAQLEADRKKAQMQITGNIRTATNKKKDII
jgi:hypothetical protein